ncbi:DUF3783 domain-containing protein [bacterium]|nr:DUF3783 domain-containing protein [bacterium]
MKKVDKTGILPGPKAILLSGFNDSDTTEIKHLFGEEQKAISFISLTKPMLEHTLLAVLSNESDSLKPLNEKEVPQVMIFSGISMELLHQVLDNLRESQIKRPIIATATEHNLTFTIKELLMHLLEEMKEFSK